MLPEQHPVEQPQYQHMMGYGGPNANAYGGQNAQGPPNAGPSGFPGPSNGGPSYYGHAQ